jgi:hypothetical protein
VGSLATERPSAAVDHVAALSGDAVALSLSVCPSTVAVSAAAGAAADPSATDRPSTDAPAATALSTGDSLTSTLPGEGKPYDHRDVIDRVKEIRPRRPEGDRCHQVYEPGKCVGEHIPDRRRVAAFRRRAAFMYLVAPCFRRRHSAAPQNRYVLRLHTVPY